MEAEEKAVLVAVMQQDQTEQQVNEYLDELAFLAETAGAITQRKFVQKLAHPDSKTFIGKGKLEEIKAYIQGKGIRVVIFDDELSGSQITNIEKVLDCKTIDRVRPDPGHFCPAGQDSPGPAPGGTGAISIYITPASRDVEASGKTGGRYRNQRSG